MLKNYFRIAIRSLVRQRLYAAINISGMAVGLASAILIMLFVRSESSYDTFYENHDRIFRVTIEETPQDGSASVNRSLLSPAVAPAIKEAFPQIEAFTRMTPVGPLFSVDDRHIEGDNVFWADPETFDIFSVDILVGDAVNGLREPFTLALGESMARRLFGSDDPVGQTVMVNSTEPFTVVAVYRDIPENSHLHFDAVGSISTLARWFTVRPFEEVWDSPNYATYVRLTSPESADELAADLSNFLATVDGRNVPVRARIRLQNISDIHLNSHVMHELEPQGNINTIILLSAIAVFILLLASINFTNLSVAASRRRDREVGIRKTAGAVRRQLIAQFIGEATVTTFVAMIAAIVLVELALPLFNSFVGKSLSLQDVGLLKVSVYLVAGCIVIGTLAGSYPAVYLSRLRPVSIFRGAQGEPGRKAGFRSSLVVIQFSIAVALMLATLVVFRQMSFIQNQQLGYNSENVIILPEIRSISQDFESFRQQLLQHADIIEVSQSNPAPAGRVIPPFDGRAYHENDTEVATIYPMWIDHEYFKTFQIPIQHGRDFDLDRPTDIEYSLILNETAARKFGWPNPEDAVGEDVFYGGSRRQVIGIARDFHQQSLHQEIVPMGFYQDARNFRAISVRFSTTDFTALLSFLDGQWKLHHPNTPLSYDLLDERVEIAYETDRRLGSMFGVFALLGIFVSCMGLFGIAAITVEQRRKEIGIRKAIGASTPRLVYSIALEFVRLAVVAILVGGTVGFFLMSDWLENFAYHGEIGWIPFALVATITVLASLAAVLFESISAARANPVESLRYE